MLYYVPIETLFLEFHKYDYHFDAMMLCFLKIVGNEYSLGWKEVEEQWEVVGGVGRWRENKTKKQKETKINEF